MHGVYRVHGLLGYRPILIELLLAKVKNASGRIGIFFVVNLLETPSLSLKMDQLKLLSSGLKDACTIKQLYKEAGR